MQIFIIILIGISLLLALIGMTTNYWYQTLSNKSNEGLWVICQRHSSESDPQMITKICRRQPYMKSQGAVVFAIILLFIALFSSIIQKYRKIGLKLIYLIIFILTGSTLLLLFSYLWYPRQFNFRQLGYSIYCMIISSLLSFITTGLVALTIKKNQNY